MSDEPERAPIGAGDYVTPVLGRKAFHCMHCNVYAPQRWFDLRYNQYQRDNVAVVSRCECSNCQQESFWQGSRPAAEAPRALMLWPLGSALAPLPHIEMPTDVRPDYDEARAIVDRSSRGAAALLRLAVQKLCKALGEKGKNINEDIGELVKKGLPLRVQQALDALRVIGNNAVHPGELDLRDDRETANSLFGLLNFIVEHQIAEPKRLDAIYKQLPQGARDQIERRDSQ